MSSVSANTIKHPALSKARRTPIQKRPEVAAIMMPTPMRPSVNTGPLATAKDDDSAESISRSRTGVTTPVSAAALQAGALQVSRLLDADGSMAKMLTELPADVDCFWSALSHSVT